MGVDAKFLLYEDGIIPTSHDVLALERRRELWPYLEVAEQLHGYNVTNEFSSFAGRDDGGEYRFGRTTETAYGIPLRAVSVLRLRPLAGLKQVQDNWRNRAVWAYLDQCPDHLMVAIYWC